MVAVINVDSAKTVGDPTSSFGIYARLVAPLMHALLLPCLFAFLLRIAGTTVPSALPRTKAMIT
jgi:hypothetical protein